MGTGLLAHGNNISIFLWPFSGIPKLWPFSGIPKSIHPNSNWIFHYKKIEVVKQEGLRL